MIAESKKVSFSLSVASDGFDVSISDSLKDIFTTRKGSVAMLPEFGSELYLLVDKRIDDEWLIDFRRYISDAVTFEPRVNLEKIELIKADASTGSIEFTLHFSDNSTFLGELNGF